MTDVMDQLAALADSSGLVPIEHVRRLVRPVVAERDEAERSANFWQSQAESWEREHQNTVLPYTSQIEDERDLAMWLHAEAVWQRDQLKIEADHQWKTRQEIGRRLLDMDTELTEKVDLGRWLVAEAIWQRDEAHAKLQHAQTYADQCAKHASVEVLRGDVAWHLRQIVTQPPHNCADASCSIQIDPCGGCCICLSGCVYNGPDEPPNICSCPGSGTLAHVRSCHLHPEASQS